MPGQESVPERFKISTDISNVDGATKVATFFKEPKSESLGYLETEPEQKLPTNSWPFIHHQMINDHVVIKSLGVGTIEGKK